MNKENVFFRLSLSFHSHHENPVGINLDSKDAGGRGGLRGGGIDGYESEGFSSTWAAALPRLVQRRNGLTGAIALGLKRSNSQDSNLNLSRSVSIRSKRFNYNSSVNSRRHSLADSVAFSVNQSELDHLQTLYKSSVRSKRSLFKHRTKLFSGRRSNKVTAIGADTDNSITSQGSEASSNGVGRVLPAITLPSFDFNDLL